jgi:hypothetical protein
MPQKLFLDLLQEHQHYTGFQMPDRLQGYLAQMLDQRLERVDIIPQPSFAERWMILQQKPRPAELQDFGDTCLFFVSLLPEYGRRRGLDRDYYATLGISSYYVCGDLTHDPCYTQLGNWFYHLQSFLTGMLHRSTDIDSVKQSLDKYFYANQ